MTVDGEVFQTGAVKVPLISQARRCSTRGRATVRCRSWPRATRTSRSSPGRRRSRRRSTGARRSRPRRAAARSCCRCRRPAARPRRSTSPASSPTCASRPGWCCGGPRPAGRTVIEATLDPGTPTTGLVVGARNRADRHAARHPHARRREDARHDRRRRRAPAVARRRDDRAGRAGRNRGPTPAGYELVGVTGSSLERSEPQADRVVLFVTPARAGGISSC